MVARTDCPYISKIIPLQTLTLSSDENGESILPPPHPEPIRPSATSWPRCSAYPSSLTCPFYFLILTLQVSHSAVCLSDVVRSSQLLWVTTDRIRPKPAAPANIAAIALKAYGSSGSLPIAGKLLFNLSLQEPTIAPSGLVFAFQFDESLPGVLHPE